MLQAVSRWLAYIGVIFFGALILITHDPWFVLILMMMASDFSVSKKLLAIITLVLFGILMSMVFFMPIAGSLTFIQVAVVLGFLTTYFRCRRAINEPDEKVETKHLAIPYPLPEPRVRFAWLGRYVLLVGTILFLMSTIGPTVHEHTKASTGLIWFIAR